VENNIKNGTVTTVAALGDCSFVQWKLKELTYNDAHPCCICDINQLLKLYGKVVVSAVSARF